MVNKRELIADVSQRTGLTKHDSELALNALITSITNTLAKGERVQIVGFGTFEIRIRNERSGRNPATGETMIIPKTKTPAFKMGNELRNSVKNP